VRVAYSESGIEIGLGFVEFDVHFIVGRVLDPTEGQKPATEREFRIVAAIGKLTPQIANREVSVDHVIPHLLTA
jgi:hypothetical protein